MPMHQEKVLRVSGDSAIASGAQVTILDEVLADSVNIHGLRLKVHGVSNTTQTSQRVIIALYCLPEAVTVPTISLANVNNDDVFADLMWLFDSCIVTSYVQGNVVTCAFEPGTSRTCPRGYRIVLVIRNDGIVLGAGSAIAVQYNLQWFETQV